MGPWVSTAITPAGPLEYLRGETIGERIGATVYNMLPGMFNTVNNILHHGVVKPLEPVNRAIDTAIEGTGNNVDQVMPGMGQGVKNLLYLGGLAVDPTKGFNRVTRITSRLGRLGEECIAAKTTTQQTGTILYSGAKGEPYARDAANWLANNTGGVTLEMTQLGARTDLATVGMPYLAQRPYWETASSQFVQNAVGNVRIVLSKRAAPSSIYINTEWQALLRNPNVTGVEFIHVP